jgi:hypothetical protein
MRIDDLNCRAVPSSGLVGAIGQDIHNSLSQILLATGSPGSMLAGGSSEFTENIIKIGILLFAKLRPMEWTLYSDLNNDRS